MIGYLLLRGVLGLFGVLLLAAIVWLALPGLLVAAGLFATSLVAQSVVQRRRRLTAAHWVGVADARRLADSGETQEVVVIVTTEEGRKACRAYARGVRQVLPEACVRYEHEDGMAMHFR